MNLVLWTPGLTALHRVLTAALLALVPPDAGLAIQAAYWSLLALHAIGWLTPIPLWATFLGLLVLPGLNGAAMILAGFAVIPWWGALFVRPSAAAFERIQLCLLSLVMFVAGIDATYDSVNPPYLLVLVGVWFVLGLTTSLRWLAWTGLLLHSGILFLLHSFIEPELLIFHALAFSPAWIPRRRDALPLTVFYDGECGFCHRGVQFLVKEDPAGAALRFAPLQGPSFTASVPEGERAALPDSIVVRDAHGELYLRSVAALRVGAALGGYWRPLAAIAWLVPRPLRDVVYDAIARRRKRWFAKPEAHCPLVTSTERARFDP